MKLAIRKEAGIIPGSGFHYMMHPMAMESDAQAAIFEAIGHIIIETNDEIGKRLLEQCRMALNHQIEIAFLTDEAEKRK